jgi:hypothetical protein
VNGMNKILGTTIHFIDLFVLYTSEGSRRTDAVRTLYGCNSLGNGNCSLELSITEGTCPFVVLTAYTN